MGKKCDCLLPDCVYCHPGITEPPPFDEMMINHKSEHLLGSPDTNRIFVNIYRDKKGRFISDYNHTTYKDAYEDRDDMNTYIETVEIIRIK